MASEIPNLDAMEKRHDYALRKVGRLFSKGFYQKALDIVNPLIAEIEGIQLDPRKLYFSFNSLVEYVVATIRWRNDMLKWKESDYDELVWFPLPSAYEYYVKGSILWELEDLMGAVDNFRKALDWNPVFGECYLEIAFYQLYHLEEPQQALDTCLLALENVYRKGSLSRAYTYLSAALANLGIWKLAEAACWKALQYQPDNIMAMDQISTIAQNAGLSFSEDSIGECDRLLEAEGLPIHPHPSFAIAYLVMGNVEMEHKKYKSAIENYLQAIGFLPELADAHSALANAYENIGQMELAEKHREIARELQEKE